MTKRALISGIGVAGPTTAYWLAKNGWEVTLIERSESLRLGGQNIDISDAARMVVEKMGVMTSIKERHTGEKGMQFVDTNNKVVAEFPVSHSGSMTREIEILRGELVDILVGASPSSVQYRFGTMIKTIAEGESSSTVTFNDDTTEEFDVVIIADGMNSSTRSLVFGNNHAENYIGCWSSYFTIPRNDNDNDWWRWYTSSTGVVAFLRPDNQGGMRASVNFLSDDGKSELRTLEEKKSELQKRLKGAGWECERISKALEEADDIFLGPLHQIKADAWHKGRCVLIGDAAHCPTPYTGMGTTLAVIGSYILANELVAHDNHIDAFKAYQEKFKAFTVDSQKLPPGVPGLAYAESRFKVGVINTGAKIAASKPIQAIASLFGGEGADTNKFQLPVYEHSS